MLIKENAELKSKMEFELNSTDKPDLELELRNQLQVYHFFL